MVIRKILKFTLVTAVICSCLFFLNKLMMPKYMTSILEGALISEYYEEPVKDHQVLFIGDCEVYENFSPITLWEDFGITSFIRGSAQQLIWQSYYLMEETLRYEKPEIMVYNVLPMEYSEPQNEAYNRLNLDGMRMSVSKLRSIKASMTKDEEWISYIFPLLRYHTRWDELTSEDFKYLLHKDTISHNGYLMRVDVKPVTSVPKGKKLPDYQFSDISYSYLDKMTAICKKNDVTLILVKAPSLYPYWYEEWNIQMVEYAKKNNLSYINFLDYTNEVGIDYSTDTYDAGLHLNTSGAEKLASYFGKILKDDYGLIDNRTNPEIADQWNQKVTFYEQKKTEQYEELEKFGYLRSFSRKDNSK